MTTTACDDQFSAEPEPVHQPYDVAAILRKNVADLELELQRQKERAEKAEEKLAGSREDLQSWIESRNGWMDRAHAAEMELKAAREQEPIGYVKYKTTGGNVGLSWIAVPTDAYYPREGEQLYARPIPAPAVPYGIDAEAANRISLAVYDCENGINPEPLLYAINRILATEIHPLSEEGQRALLKSAEVTK